MRRKKIFGFLDPAVIMSVIVALIILGVGVFAVFTVVNTTEDNIEGETSSSTTRTETFETDTNLADPSDSWYTYTEVGFDGNVYDNTATARGDKSYRINDSNGDQDYALFDTVSADYNRIDFWFMIDNSTDYTNTSYIDWYNGTVGENPNMSWYTYTESPDIGDITNDSSQPDGNYQSYNLTYDGFGNASFNFTDGYKTIDYLWFGFNQSSEGNNDGSGEKIAFMNDYYQEIVSFEWVDQATDTIYVNGHDMTADWSANSWDIIRCKINWTDATVSARWNSEAWTDWYAFNNPAVTRMQRFNFTTNETGIGADMYIDNIYLYDNETVVAHEQVIVNVAKSNELPLCYINITDGNCTFENSTTVGWDETILTNTYYRVRLDPDFTNDSVQGRIYDSGGTLQAGGWLEMYDGSEVFEEISNFNVTGVSDKSSRFYLDNYYFLDTNTEATEIPDIGGTANSVFGIIGIVLIIGAIMAIVGIVSKYGFFGRQ